MSEDFSTRVFDLMKRRREIGNKLTKDLLAAELGCSRTMLYNYEQGDPLPPPEILSSMNELEKQVGIEQMSSYSLSETPAGYSSQRRSQDRRIKVVGWAHAGEAASYEQMPDSWQETIPTDCRTPGAFAVRLQGDSMEPKFTDGDLLVLMPQEQAHSGVFAVVKFLDDGVLFRRVEFVGSVVRLMPLNERYEATDHARDEFAWIYPVWARTTQMWR